MTKPPKKPIEPFVPNKPVKEHYTRRESAFCACDRYIELDLQSLINKGVERLSCSVEDDEYVLIESHEMQEEPDEDAYNKALEQYKKAKEKRAQYEKDLAAWEAHHAVKAAAEEARQKEIAKLQKRLAELQNKRDVGTRPSTQE